MSNSIRNFWEQYWVNGNVLIRLIIVNVGVFLALNFINLVGLITAGVGNNFMGTVVEYLGMPANAHVFLRQPWGLVTSIFMHVGFSHLLWNMVTIYMFGNIFGDLIGGKRLLMLYFLGGIAGCFFYIFSCYLFPALYGNYDTTVSSISGICIGASAAGTAIMVATAVKFPDFEIGLLFFGNVKIKFIALVFLVLDLISIGAQQNTGGHFAHLGGAVMGAVYILSLERGIDLGEFFTTIYSFFKGLFKPKPKFTHKNPSRNPVYSETEKRESKSRRTAKPTPSRDHQEELDAILDKIRASGYDSLSKEEKDFLFRASKS